MPDLFYPIEADGADYPQPAVPLLAPPECSGWFGVRQRDAVSAFLAGGESFVNGRYALAEAMRRAGVRPGKAVLLPSFHCRAVVEPVLYLGAVPKFYPVTEDLRPDFAALLGMTRTTGPEVRAMVLTHYFGFPNALGEARNFCSSNGIALIEDCAHALYGRDGERLLGSVGDYAAASLWKFLPVREGAVLLDRIGLEPAARMAHRPVSAELKGLAGLLEACIRHALTRKPLPALYAAAIAAQAKAVANRHVPRAAQQGLKEFSPLLANTAGLRCSQWLASSVDHGFVMSRRRAHYLRWSAEIRGLAGARPLYPSLPEGVVPYAFPLLLDAPEEGFHRLKVAGVPMWRWEDMARTDCATARDYRLRLVQLPCHQALGTAELDWMIEAVRTLLPYDGCDPCAESIGPSEIS